MLKRLFQSLYPQPSGPRSLGAVRSQVDEASGWQSLSGRPHDRDLGEIQALYADALTAWRKNPLAWRAITLTTDAITGEGVSISSPNRNLNRFIHAFWHHPLNQMDMRLETLSNELAISGDLFILLFRNPVDGMSYLRLATKDQIRSIATAPNDWEVEFAFEQAVPGEVVPKTWLSFHHPQAASAEAVMLHYAVNRPAGALLGESDLAPILPWLLRYSRMLEDRVRLHWAARAFLYLVTVPPTKVESKAAQYSTPPEPGSIIIKDESERWETITPALRGADAAHDLKALRHLIDAGSGFPPHWRGEGGDVNLATAEAMQGPPERHLRRRQQFFLWMLQDILFKAYQRAVQVGKAAPLASTNYKDLFWVKASDIAPRDNLFLAQAANQLAEALVRLQGIAGSSPRLAALAADLILRFAGEPISDELARQIADAQS